MTTIKQARELRPGDYIRNERTGLWHRVQCSYIVDGFVIFKSHHEMLGWYDGWVPVTQPVEVLVEREIGFTDPAGNQADGYVRWSDEDIAAYEAGSLDARAKMEGGA